jgi:hypothetical protein
MKGRNSKRDLERASNGAGGMLGEFHILETKIRKKLRRRDYPSIPHCWWVRKDAGWELTDTKHT